MVYGVQLKNRVRQKDLFKFNLGKGEMMIVEVLSNKLTKPPLRDYQGQMANTPLTLTPATPK